MRNPYPILSEKMGLDWHASHSIYGFDDNPYKYMHSESPDFFFAWWNWAQKQEWWEEFMDEVGAWDYTTGPDAILYPVKLIHPTRGPKTCERFLRNRGEK